ncbi:hypothetical protein ONS95_007345 [Cadophora gregata]|uniref:uncharacterized protein n=1 Tax=Cadophora gregata TaxID=51156 RepID=UPI0026DA95C0|nr:uncharacterized protein ONS95_007345 [Cadophora gregata]KAK0100901.1 hypothetical protein ONS95_007345 [Cadophora gregata]
MADPQEPAELAGEGDLREDKGMRQEDSTRAPMAEAEQATAIVNEDMDSRTSLAGRKRNLQGLGHGDKENGEEVDDERLRKRVKDHQDPPLEGGLVAGITSPPLEVLSVAQAEADTGHQSSASEPSVFKLLQEESQKSQGPGAESHSIFNLMGKGPRDSAPNGSTKSAAVPSASWNGGISTGLRTSFAGKARSSFGLKSTTTPALVFQDTVTSADPVGGVSGTSSVLSTYAESPIVPSSSELNKEEQDNLDSEEKKLHLKAIFAQFREPAASKVVMPPVNNDKNATGATSRYTAKVDDDRAQSSTAGQDQHVPFRKLKKAARDNLSPVDRLQYNAALKAHNVAKREKRERKRGLKSKEQPASSLEESEVSTGSQSLEGKSPNPILITSDSEGHQDEENATKLDISQTGLKQPAPFVKLTKNQIKLLNEEQLEEYNRSVNTQLAQKRLEKKAMKAQSRIEELQQASEKVSVAFTKTSSPSYTFPTSLTKMIESGKTFYARKLPAVPEYGNKNGSWKLYEILSTDAKPLQIHDVSFNRFAPYFLSCWKADWSSMTQKVLTAAFSIYVTNYYGHLIGVGSALESCRTTASASDAITLKDAKVLANQLLQHSGPPQTLQTVPLTIQPESVNISDPGISKPYVNNDTDTMMEDAADTVASNAGHEVAFANPPDADEEPIDFDLRQAELYLQQRYYPSSDLNIMHCLACSKTGHKTLECPLMKCSICQTRGIHSEAMCPQKKRCNRCRERGHQTEACKEKLSLPKSEMSCDICHSPDHLEMACHYVWRSFDPRPEEIFTVQNIPVECYICGNSDHFGPECGLHRGVALSGGLTWSKHNLSMYVDPSSNNRAISAGKDYSIPPKGPKRGNANDPITIDEESDAEPFIRPKVLPSHPKGGKIQVQPVQQNQQAATKNGKQNKSWQPAPPSPPYQRHPNPPRASRPDFGFDYPFNNASQNPPLGPRGGGPNNFGDANRGGRGGRGIGRRGGGVPTRAERRRMANQAGA